MNRLRLVLLPLLATVAAACGGGGAPPFEFGIQSVALDLAFSEPELVVPVPPNVIVQLIPAPPGVTGDDLDRFVDPAPPIPPLFPPCPTAPEGSPPTRTVSFAVDDPPDPGAYRRHNTGDMHITGGPFEVVLPFPPITTWDIGEPEEITSTDPLGTTTTVQRYEVRKTLSSSFIVTDLYEIRVDRVVLLRRTTRTGAGESVFEPSPPIDFFVFGQEGDTWSSGGIDLERGASMVVQGAIVSREIVDVCGEVVDTYRVSSSETMVDLTTGETSGTSQDDPNIYNIATHLGGLVVREDVHSTLTTKDPGSGAPLVVEFDYVSTLDSVDPVPSS